MMLATFLLAIPAWSRRVIAARIVPTGNKTHDSAVTKIRLIDLFCLTVFATCSVQFYLHRESGSLAPTGFVLLFLLTVPVLVWHTGVSHLAELGIHSWWKRLLYQLFIFPAMNFVIAFWITYLGATVLVLVISAPEPTPFSSQLIEFWKPICLAGAIGTAIIVLLVRYSLTRFFGYRSEPGHK